MREHRIVVEPLTASAFEPFGWVVEGGGSEVHFTRPLLDVWTFPFASDAPPRLQIMRYHRQPLRLHRLERHLKVTETRLAMDDAAAVITVAASAAPVPPPETVRAFKLDNRAAVMLRAGIWHGLDCIPVASDYGDFLFLSDHATEEELEGTRTPGAEPRTDVMDYHRELGLELVLELAP